MKIHWLEEAVYDLQTLCQDVGQDNPYTSNYVARKIFDKVHFLFMRPDMGRQGRVMGTRELIISGTPYIVPYRLENNIIEILRILDQPIEWPENSH